MKIFNFITQTVFRNTKICVLKVFILFFKILITQSLLGVRSIKFTQKFCAVCGFRYPRNFRTRVRRMFELAPIRLYFQIKELSIFCLRVEKCKKSEKVFIFFSPLIIIMLVTKNVF